MKLRTLSRLPSVRSISAGLVACALVVVSSHPRALAQTPTKSAPTVACDRACLETFVDLYMEALIAHKPAMLAISPKIKNTEDGVQLDPGDGFWRTAMAKGGYRLFATDTETGSVAFLGTMREVPANPVIVMIRLKISNRQITEIENLVVRDAAAATNLENLGQPSEVFKTEIPAPQRGSRAALINTANLYYNGLQNNDGKLVPPFTADCQRIQNGTQTTNNPNAMNAMTPATTPSAAGGRGKGGPAPPPVAPKPAEPSFNVGALGCTEQFKSGYFHFVTRVRDRRFVVVDRERGLVFAIASFDQPAGKYRSYKMADGRDMMGGPERQTTLVIGELFKIEADKIRRVEAVQLTVPYGMIAGWSSWEDGMSSKARDVK